MPIRSLWILLLLASTHLSAQSIASGQWYDRYRSGHGLDLNRSGTTLFGTFYTYDQELRPEWLWLQENDSGGTELRGQFSRFRKLGTQPPIAEVAGSYRIQSVSRCSDGLARSGSQFLEFRAELAGGTLLWCLEPLLPSTSIAQSALDGHWYAPELDSGWGLVTHFLALNPARKAFIPEFPLEGAMIAQDFETTGDFPIERNTQVYCRLRKISCGFKRLARARRLMENPGSYLLLSRC